MEKTPDNIKYGDMTADFRMRYKKMMEQKNRTKVKNKKNKSTLEAIAEKLYGGNK